MISRSWPSSSWIPNQSQPSTWCSPPLARNQPRVPPLVIQPGLAPHRLSIHLPFQGQPGIGGIIHGLRTRHLDVGQMHARAERSQSEAAFPAGFRFGESQIEAGLLLPELESIPGRPERRRRQTHRIGDAADGPGRPALGHLVCHGPGDHWIESGRRSLADFANQELAGPGIHLGAHFGTPCGRVQDTQQQREGVERRAGVPGLAAHQHRHEFPPAGSRSLVMPLHEPPLHAGVPARRLVTQRRRSAIPQLHRPLPLPLAERPFVDLPDLARDEGIFREVAGHGT